MTLRKKVRPCCLALHSINSHELRVKVQRATVNIIKVVIFNIYFLFSAGHSTIRNALVDAAAYLGIKHNGWHDIGMASTLFFQVEMFSFS